mmetsp:Transcript_94352/g.197055  ORF Transcript_94352/g.197055 Transcript_94352/m.197055 type:complete len:346 (-) Transcript_94352:23-1060(-)
MPLRSPCCSLVMTASVNPWVCLRALTKFERRCAATMDCRVPFDTSLRYSSRVSFAASTRPPSDSRPGRTSSTTASSSPIFFPRSELCDPNWKADFSNAFTAESIAVSRSRAESKRADAFKNSAFRSSAASALTSAAARMVSNSVSEVLTPVPVRFARLSTSTTPSDSLAKRVLKASTSESRISKCFAITATTSPIVFVVVVVVVDVVVEVVDVVVVAVVVVMVGAAMVIVVVVVAAAAVDDAEVVEVAASVVVAAAIVPVCCTSLLRADRSPFCCPSNSSPEAGENADKRTARRQKGGQRAVDLAQRVDFLAIESRNGSCTHIAKSLHCVIKVHWGSVHQTEGGP